MKTRDHDMLPPYAWINDRPYGRDVRKALAGERESMSASVIRAVLEGRTSSLLEAAVMTHVCEDAVSRGLASRDAYKVADREMWVTNAIARFIHAGGNAFSFTQRLSTELAETDIHFGEGDERNVTCDEVQAPYPALYIEFRGTDLGYLPDGRRLDGFIVALSGPGDPAFEAPAENDDYDGRLLTITPMSRMVPELFEATGTIFPDIRVKLIDGKTINEMIAEALHDRLANFEVTGDYSVDDKDPAAMREIDLHRQTALRDYQALVASSEGWLHLVVNGLLFIDNCRSGVRRGWPEQAPADLVETALANGPKSVKADKKLRSFGFTALSLCDLSDNEAGEEARGEGGVTMHWRRGHWRRQPYGPGSSLRRRQRVRPTIVGRRKTQDEPKSGRDYVITRGADTIQ